MLSCHPPRLTDIPYSFDFSLSETLFKPPIITPSASYLQLLGLINTVLVVADVEGIFHFKQLVYLLTGHGAQVLSAVPTERVKKIISLVDYHLSKVVTSTE